MNRYFPQNELAFCPYALVWYPTMDVFHDVVDVLVDAWAHILELWVPFSDPSADGPVLTAANAHVVDRWYDIADIFQAIFDVKKRHPQVWVCVMGYYNSFFAYGLDRFAQQSVKHDIDGILIPDLPVQEDINIEDMYRVMIAANNVSDKVLQDINNTVSGFVYVLSSVRTTWSDDDYRGQLAAFIDRLKQYMPNKKLVVGFGIKNSDDIAYLKTLDVDGFIVWSEITRRINQWGIKTLKDYLYSELLS